MVRFDCSCIGMALSTEVKSLFRHGGNCHCGMTVAQRGWETAS